MGADSDFVAEAASDTFVLGESGFGGRAAFTSSLLIPRNSIIRFMPVGSSLVGGGFGGTRMYSDPRGVSKSSYFGGG